MGVVPASTVGVAPAPTVGVAPTAPHRLGGRAGRGGDAHQVEVPVDVDWAGEGAAQVQVQRDHCNTAVQFMFAVNQKLNLLLFCKYYSLNFCTWLLLLPLLPGWVEGVVDVCGVDTVVGVVQAVDAALPRLTARVARLGLVLAVLPLLPQPAHRLVQVARLQGAPHRNVPAEEGGCYVVRKRTLSENF